MRNRFFHLRLLRTSLIVGALYDLVFAAALVMLPQLVGKTLRVPLPEPFYLWVIAVLLGMVAALYLAAADDPRRYSAVIVVAILGRLAGAAVLALAARRFDGLWPAAAGELLFGAAHGWLWSRIR